MAIIGLGTDIVEIARVEESYRRLGDKFAARILTPAELAQMEAKTEPYRFLAKRFAVKEAAAKALGTGIGRGVSFQHLELENNNNGAPKLRFSGGALHRFYELGGQTIHVSLSDERHYATATVILEGRPLSEQSLG